MKIRTMVSEDMVKLNELHDKYLGDQFEKTNFMDKFLSNFVLEHEGKIVMGGGVRPIAETIIVTDKSMSPHLLGDALLEALRFSLFTCSRFQIDLLHAFVKDEAYAKHLIKHGFNPRCQALYMDVTNGK